jgi:hypothetical protein
MGFLDGYMSSIGAISRTLDKMQARDGRQTFQVLKGEYQWIVDHAVNHQAMLFGVDIGDKGAASRAYIVQ